MRRRSGLLVSLFAAGIAIAGCSGGGGSSPGGGGSSQPTEPPPIVESTTFPASLATASGGGTAWAITGVKTTLYGQFHDASGNAYDTLRVDVTFAQNVANALPSPGQSLTLPTQLGIEIGINTGVDGFFETCSNSASDAPNSFQSDAGRDPSRLTDGNYNIISENGPIYAGPPDPEAEAQTSVSGTVMTQIFDLSALGVGAGVTVPQINVDVAAFNGVGDVGADCVPASGSQLSAS